MSELWYAIHGPDDHLTQGDLVEKCPLIGWTHEPIDLEDSDRDEVEVLDEATQAVWADVVVMTQACDLKEGKVHNVILCPCPSLSTYRQEWEADRQARKQGSTAKAWASLCNNITKGYLWNLAMLNSGTAGELATEHRIVDFHEVYSIPRRFLESLLARRRTHRLRLLPPYREHLSQAFARFFMRVGFPTSIEEPWNPKK